MLEAALEMARRGWAVFPVHTPGQDGRCSCGNARCGSPGKHPRTAQGFKDATTSEEQIRKWWRQWPDANIGLATGEASNVIVVDVDGAPGEQAIAERELCIPDTLEAQTARGRHIFFRWPGRRVPNAAAALPKVDVRGDGGYVVAPPSKHASGATYRWANEEAIAPMPQWVWDILGGDGRAARQDVAGGKAAPNAAIPEGARNDTLFKIACSWRAKGLTGPQIRTLLEAEGARCQPPLGHAELDQIASSAAKYAPEDVPDVPDWMSVESTLKRVGVSAGTLQEVKKAVEKATDESQTAAVAAGITIDFQRRTPGPGKGATFDARVSVDGKAATLTGLTADQTLTFATMRGLLWGEGLVLLDDKTTKKAWRQALAAAMQRHETSAQDSLEDVVSHCVALAIEWVEGVLQPADKPEDVATYGESRKHTTASGEVLFSGRDLDAYLRRRVPDALRKHRVLAIREISSKQVTIKGRKDGRRSRLRVFNPVSQEGE